MNFANWCIREVQKSAKIWFPKSIFYVKNYRNLSDFFFHWKYEFRSTFFFYRHFLMTILYSLSDCYSLKPFKFCISLLKNPQPVLPYCAPLKNWSDFVPKTKKVCASSPFIDFKIHEYFGYSEIIFKNIFIREMIS